MAQVRITVELLGLENIPAANTLDENGEVNSFASTCWRGNFRCHRGTASWFLKGPYIVKFAPLYGILPDPLSSTMWSLYLCTLGLEPSCVPSQPVSPILTLH